MSNIMPRRKLQCILVDDDPSVHSIFKDYLNNNEYAEVTDYYDDPVKFIDSKKKPDLVFVDIELPNIDGFSLAISIKPTPVILFTGHAEKFRDIMNMMEAIDAFPKPIIKERLLKSVEDAYVLLNSAKSKKAHKLFHTDKGEVNVLLSDIFLVRTVKHSHRNLEMFLKGGRRHILVRYSLDEIHDIAEDLLRANRFELVSPDAIDIIEPNSMLKLKGLYENGKHIYSELHRNYRKDFLIRFPLS
jgi:DNA-binding LytR/AlgR family response regulator